jgi:hypothetical protein
MRFPHALANHGAQKNECCSITRNCRGGVVAGNTAKLTSQQNMESSIRYWNSRGNVAFSQEIMRQKQIKLVLL